MSVESYHFKVGDFECIAISDGIFTYKPPRFPPATEFLFTNASKEDLAQALREYNWEAKKLVEWTSPYICLFINTGKNQILVDTGAGKLGSNTGRLLQNLKAEGIKPKDIDAVILTHGHPDHIGGNIVSGKIAFPKSEFIMWKDEWNFWTREIQEQEVEEHKKMLLTIAKKNLLPIQDQISLLNHQTEIVSGILAIPSPGHTPGHMTIKVTSGENLLFCIADVALHSIHLEHPDWHATVDFSPQQLLRTRLRLFSQATEEKALVLAFHFPFPGLGYILQKEERWRWQPI